jgi:pyruvate/2-oxoglutarate/acetoin dehydrogenase E1 component
VPILSLCVVNSADELTHHAPLARRCHRVLIVHEDARTGGIGESPAAVIQEEAFEDLDAPVRIAGSLDTVSLTGRRRSRLILYRFCRIADAR